MVFKSSTFVAAEIDCVQRLSNRLNWMPFKLPYVFRNHSDYPISYKAVQIIRLHSTPCKLSFCIRCFSIHPITSDVSQSIPFHSKPFKLFHSIRIISKVLLHSKRLNFIAFAVIQIILLLSKQLKSIELDALQIIHVIRSRYNYLNSFDAFQIIPCHPKPYKSIPITVTPLYSNPFKLSHITQRHSNYPISFKAVEVISVHS